MRDDPYKVLQVDPGAYPEVIEAAYRVLSDPARRREYDRRRTRRGFMKLVFGSGSGRAIAVRLATTALPLLVVGGGYVFLLQGLGGDGLAPELPIPTFEERLAMLTPTAKPTSVPPSPEAEPAPAVGGADRDRLLKAVAEHKAAIDRDPEDAESLVRRGVAYVALGQHELAIADFDEAVRLRPDLPGAFFERAVAFGHAGQVERSVEDYTRAIRLDPGYAVAYANRALVYVFLGRDAEAQQDVDRAVELGIDEGQLADSVRALKERR